jgi:1,4-dihydroxy-2-naphthoate octaprenyltransferase
VGIAVRVEPWAALGVAGVVIGARAWWQVRSGATGPELVAVLRDTGVAELVYAAGLFAGLVIGA